MFLSSPNFFNSVPFFDAHRIDSRSNSQIGESVLIHKKGSKVTGLHFNPVQPDLLLSCGNDHFVRGLPSSSGIFPN